MHGHGRHNTTVLSIIHDMSTTCFGQHFLAIIRLDTIIADNYTVYNVIQYNHQCWCRQGHSDPPTNVNTRKKSGKIDGTRIEHWQYALYP